MADTLMSYQELVKNLQRDLADTTEPEEQLPILDRLSEVLTFVDPVQSTTYAEQVYRLGEGVDGAPWQARACLRIASSARVLADFRKAQRYLNKAKKVLDTTSGNHVDKSLLYYNYGKICTNHRGDVLKAREWHGMALKEARASGDKRLLANILYFVAETDQWLGGEVMGTLEECIEVCEAAEFEGAMANPKFMLGDLYRDLQDWENAERYYGESLEISKKTGHTAGTALGYIALGRVYSAQKQFALALEYLQKGIEISKEVGDRLRQITALTTMANIYIQQGALVSAHNCLQEVISFCEESGNKVLYANALIELGLAHAAEEKWREAIDAWTTAYQINSDEGILTGQIDNARNLAQVYEITGNLPEALRYHKKWMEAEAKFTSKSLRTKILGLPIRLRIKRMRHETEALHTRVENLEHEARHRQKEAALLTLRMTKNREAITQLRERVVDMVESDGVAPSLVQDVVDYIDERIVPVKTWEVFEEQILELDPAFIHKLLSEYPSLTPAELRICVLLKLTLSNKEIATMLNVSDQTVEKHRGRIRRKMDLERSDNLVSALNAL